MRVHENPLNDKYFFFIPKKKFIHQLQYYKLFVIKHGISVEVLNECLIEFGNKYADKCNKSTILILSREKFPEFLSIITKNTGIKFKKK